jgi:hypothetical protein
MDSAENLFIGPADSGAPIAEYQPPYSGKPALLEVPKTFGVYTMAEKDGTLFAGGDTFASGRSNWFALVYRKPYGTVTQTITVPPGFELGEITTERRSLIIDESSQRAGAVVRRYAPPYGNKPNLQVEVPGSGWTTYVDGARTIMIITLSGGKGHLFLDRWPYDTKATEVLTFPVSASLATAANSRGVLFVTRGGNVLAYYPPYKQPPRTITVGAPNGAYVSRLAVDKNDNLFLLAEQALMTVRNVRLTYGIYEFQPPYTRALWQTGMHIDPGNNINPSVLGVPGQ